MIPLAKYPTIVEKYAPHFREVFSEQGYIEFKRYISGLIVSENKTVEGINRLCVHESRNQSSLNRLMTKSPYSLEELNKERLDLLESVAGTSLKQEGVLSIDDTLLKHYGKHFEQIAYLYDHTEKRYVWAHNLVTLHYSDDQTDYPLYFDLWKPVDLDKLEKGLLKAGINLKEDKQSLKTEDLVKWRQYLVGVWRRHQKEPKVAALYNSKLTIAKQLLKAWVKRHPDDKRPVAFDSWYTQPAFCRFIGNTLRLPYVGTLDGTNEVLMPTGYQSLASLAKQLKEEHLKGLAAGNKPVFRATSFPFKGKNETYYAYCVTYHVKNFGKVRLVFSHREPDLSDDPAFFISNRLHWQATGILRIRRHRWPVEVYHEEGKAEGLEQYQLRDFGAIKRHIALVALVYSLLRIAQHDPDLRDQLQRELKLELEGSVPFWRRVSQAHSLWSLALLIYSGLAQGRDRHLVTFLTGYVFDLTVLSGFR